MSVGERVESTLKPGQAEEENPITGGIFSESGLFSGRGRNRYRLFYRSRSPGRRHRRRHFPLRRLNVVDF